MLPFFTLFSLFLLWRGHNHPGGGFAAGLVAAAGLALYVIAYDVQTARRLLRVNPRSVMAFGLLVAVASGLLGVIAGEPFMTGQWLELKLSALGDLKLGTPLLFDLGVALVVFAITLTIVFSLSEE
jgi:multicomponent Na+:H+ antiporter subunit B